MVLRRKLGLCVVLLTAFRGLHAAPAAPASSGAMGWQISLRSGFDLTCARMEPQGAKTRLYLHANTNDFFEVKSADVLSVEQVELPPDPPAAAAKTDRVVADDPRIGAKSRVDVAPLAADSAALANLDKDIILSIIHAESAENPRAVSRVGARGLMQLMPSTASNMRISDAFNPAKNVDGGTAYFEYLFERYHENLAKALAAYNAGPGAVDKYHGVPPYRETRAYVARVINEFNRRKRLAMRGAPTAEASLQLASLAGH
jgi:hypothetical protein